MAVHQATCQVVDRVHSCLEEGQSPSPEEDPSYLHHYQSQQEVVLPFLLVEVPFCYLVVLDLEGVPSDVVHP